MKKTIICLPILIGVGWLSYALFQPIFDHYFGWEKIPESTYESQFLGVEDTAYRSAIDQAKNLIDSIQQNKKLPSISIATMIGGKMAWSYAVGYQNLKERIPADTSTLYRIGSVSKALTSLGLGVLIQEGSIQLDSSIQYYTGKFLHTPKITIRQLASHQSGIRNYITCFCFPVWEYYRNKSFENVEESLDDFEHDPLLFKPDESFSYSSYNYTAMSLAMESAQSLSFLDFMGKHVFGPLGMLHTRANSDADRRQAVPYVTDVNYFKQAPEVDMSNKWAGGGFVSTPSDLVRAGNALLDTLLVNSKIISEITTPQRLNDDSVNPQNYALSMRHGFSRRYLDGTYETEVIHHGGMAVGGLALLVVFPKSEMVIALTINKGGQEGEFELFDYITKIANAFLEKIEEDKF
ncbi:MAG: serine hydrolase domain-containing protein [Ekhidna sp.]